MSRPLLPPKGVFVPSSLIYHPTLPPAVFQTWVQLRGLAWGIDFTPCMPLTEMAAIIGKPHSTLYRHMSHLKTLGALSWRTTGTGSIIVSFSVDQAPALQPAAPSVKSNSENPESQFRELPSPSSFNPLSSFDSLEIPEEKSDSFLKENQESKQIKKNDKEKDNENDKEDGISNLGIPNSRNREFDPSILDAVTIYQTLTNLTPNEVQADLIRSTIKNRLLWHTSLEHWLLHNWNPLNIQGLLDFYTHNGDISCRACHKPRPH
jgi:hypothetical protein